MAQHELVKHGVDAGARGRVEHARADFGQVVECGRAAEDLDAAAHGARRLERVVERRQLRMQQRPAGEAVVEPQVLVGRDVPEVPHERAHDRVDHALEVLVGEVADQRQRPCALGLELADELVGVGEGGGLHPPSQSSKAPKRYSAMTSSSRPASVQSCLPSS